MEIAIEVVPVGAFFGVLLALERGIAGEWSRAKVSELTLRMKKEAVALKFAASAKPEAVGWALLAALPSGILFGHSRRSKEVGQFVVRRVGAARLDLHNGTSAAKELINVVSRLAPLGREGLATVAKGIFVAREEEKVTRLLG